MQALIAPHGGRLVELLVAPEQQAVLKASTAGMPAWDLTPRQLCDLELLQNGAFSPLEGFLSRADYASVCSTMRLGDGTLWPMPVTLDVTEAFAESIKDARQIALRDAEGVTLAILDIGDVWTPDREAEAQHVFGTVDAKHAGVAHLLDRTHPVYVGGRVHALEAPRHYDFGHLRATPGQLRAMFTKMGWSRVVAFQTRNPMHRAHVELTFRAAQIAEANLLIHPVVGLTKPGDIDHYTRVRCYEKLLRHYPDQTTALSLLHLAMRMGGPREALWHAIIRKNHGCTHFIVGRDHAGPGNDSSGTPFYGPYDAQTLVAEHEAELGIGMVPFQEMVYVQERAQYLPADEVQPGDSVLNISGTELRRRLQEGLEIPSWFTYPEVIEELRRTHP
ncbi:MAG: sulfate adenylyltransferase, partial [Dokdonella sp.]